MVRKIYRRERSKEVQPQEDFLNYVQKEHGWELALKISNWCRDLREKEWDELYWWLQRRIGESWEKPELF